MKMLRPTLLVYALGFVCAVNFAVGEVPDSLVKEFNEDTWRELLEGEWMVEFYAPWCPACTALAPAWKELSLRADSKLGIKTGAIDVTKSPGLSGRFFVTALPTIYHVKNREFRQYKGPRDVDSMLSWLQEGRWRQVEPVSSWKSPDSMQMSVLAWFFKLSQALRGIHTMLMETYGLPVWGSYLIFAIATIFIGAVLGLLLVCCVDLLVPRSAQQMPPPSAADAQPLVDDDLLDDVDDQQQSSSEENSQSQAEDQPSSAEGTPELRKRRRPRSEQ